MPLKDSLSIAKIGDRARPSILFNSRDVATNVLLTLAKYQTNGGMKTRVTGITDTADMSAPRTKNSMTRKSNNVVGRRSSLLPTSAENLFRILPIGFVSKNSILDLRTDLVISSWSRLDA
mmetsp:Transcript_7010/g.15438  ORF Transcript_7010/g.15438 Transcript_7010/m.15438 type:complete len:120 (+) Transcript_7010:1208-1567(+)